MNSLEELNNYSLSDRPFTDARPTSVTFTSTANQTITGVEGDDHLLPVGGNITAMMSAPNTFKYTIDLSACNGATLNHGPLPGIVTFTSTQPGVYHFTGFRSVNEWNQIKQPTVVIPKDYSGTFTYTCTVDCGTAGSMSWSVNVTLTDYSEVSTLTPPSVTYDEDVPLVFGPSNVFQITDPENSDGVYTLVATLSTSTAGVLSSSYNTGITYSFNNGVMIASGGNRDQTNYFLQGLIFTPANDFDQSFTITWQVSSYGSVVTTTIMQTVNIGTTNQEITNMGLTRTYYKNGYDLLFPDNVPQIVEPDDTSTYTIEFTMSGAYGWLGLGENFSTKPDWTAATNRYSYTGSRYQCNQKLLALRYFPNQDSTSNFSITYKQWRNGVLQAQQVFSVTSAIRNYISQPAIPALYEDTTASLWGRPTFYPYYNQSFSVLFTVLTSGSTATANILWFEKDGTDWTRVTGTPGDLRLYANFPAANDITTFLYNLSVVNGTGSLNNVRLRFLPDVSGAFKMKSQFYVNSTYNGTAFVGGFEPMVGGNIASYTITDDGAEYTLSNNSYLEDVPIQVLYNITDSDVNATSYTVRITPTSPTNCKMIVDGVSGAYNAATPDITGSKSYVNGRLVKIDMPPDFTGNVTFNYYQSKVTNGVTVVQANNVSKTYTFGSADVEGALYSTTYTEDLTFTLPYTISDADDSAQYYTCVFDQVSPNPTTTPWYLERMGNAIPVNTTLSFTRSKTYNPATDWIKVRPPVDYTGTIQVKYNQYKVDEFGANTHQITDQIVSYTCLSQTELDAPATISGTIYNYRLMNDIVITDGDPNIDTGDTTVVPRQYTLTCYTSPSNGKWRLNGVDISGQVTLSGTKTEIHNALTTLYYLPTIATYDQWGAVIYNGGSVPLTITLTRTTPNTGTLATKTILSRQNEPANGTIFLGGYYCGRYNPLGGTANHYLIAAPEASYQQTLRYFYTPQTTVTTQPSANSSTDGLTNSNDLITWASGQGVTSVAGVALDISINGYDDWYLPSTTEMINMSGKMTSGQWKTGTYWTSSINTGTPNYVNTIVYYAPDNLSNTTVFWNNINTTQAQVRPVRRVQF